MVKGTVNGPIVSVQELNIFKTSMLWMMFTIYEKKIEHQFLFDVDMKRKKDLNMASILVHSEKAFCGVI